MFEADIKHARDLSKQKYGKQHSHHEILDMKNSARRKSINWQLGQRFSENIMLAARLKINIIKDMQSLHFEDKDNFKLERDVLVEVFKKAGRYIEYLGYAIFCTVTCMLVLIRVACA